MIRIIEGDYLYIDKTEIARSLIDSYQYVFLSRPRLEKHHQTQNTHGRRRCLERQNRQIGRAGTLKIFSKR